MAGPHSEGREYDYHGRHITETPVDALPWLADSEIAPMLAAFEEIMAGCGWEKVVPAIGKDAIGTKVYDLLPDQIFTLSDGEQITLEDLERLARRGVGLGDHGEVPAEGLRHAVGSEHRGRPAFEHTGSGDLRPRGAVPVRHQIRGAAPLEERARRSRS